MNRFISGLICGGMALSSLSVDAANLTPPNSGIIEQQQLAQPNQPPASSQLSLGGTQAPQPATEQGGQRIILNQVNFIGNTIFTDEQLQHVIGNIQGQSLDLAGIRQLANAITRFYRQQGYTFATALLPAQKLSSGHLLIQIVEGQYGEVSVISDDPALTDMITPYLSSLKSGEVIDSSTLERELLLVKDLPGITSTPVLKPGSQTGQGDLIMNVTPEQRVHAQFGLDNHGSRYSGEYRMRSGLRINRVLHIGDELSLTASYSNEDTWLGGIRYTLPVGHDGWRGSVSYSHTDYQLSHGFEGYTGTADIYAIGASYPWWRTQNTNMSFSGDYQYKRLNDDVLTSYSRAAHSQSLPLSMNFDHRDALAGGGMTWGALTFTPGKITETETDSASQKSQFTKWNLEVSRLQNLSNGWNLYAHFKGQWADHESLDGSESFYIGGPNEVRAYPAGEGSDARGYLAQFEVRYQAIVNHVTPYWFFDTGYTPNGGTDTGDSRYLNGSGLGLRATYWDINLNTAIAWKIDGGNALSDSHQRDPRIWFTGQYAL